MIVDPLIVVFIVLASISVLSMSFIVWLDNRCVKLEHRVRSLEMTVDYLSDKKNEVAS